MTPPEFRVWGLPGLPEVQPGDDLARLILAALEALAGQAPGYALQDGDILVITSKIVSKAEGRQVAAADREAAIAMDTVRVVAERRHAGGVTRIVETPQGFVMAAAGLDMSNVPEGLALRLPEDPDLSARQLCAALREALGLRLGVLITDTFGRPWRQGQTDVAIGAAGLRLTDDLRGGADANGRPLHVTQSVAADEIAGAADLVKGKASGIPVAVVRGLGRYLAGIDAPGARSLVRVGEDDMFRLGAREAWEQGFAAGLAQSPGAGVSPAPGPEQGPGQEESASPGQSPGSGEGSVSGQGDVPGQSAAQRRSAPPGESAVPGQAAVPGESARPGPFVSPGPGAPAGQGAGTGQGAWSGESAGPDVSDGPGLADAPSGAAPAHGPDADAGRPAARTAGGLVMGCAALLAALALAPQPGVGQTRYPLVMENCGHQLTVPAPPQRIVAVKSSAAELVLSLGAGRRLAGIGYPDAPLPAALMPDGAQIPVLSEKLPSMEVVLSAAPDFVYGGWESVFSDEAAGSRTTLAGLGVASYVAPSACRSVPPGKLSFGDIFAEMSQMGEILDAGPAAAALIAAQRQMLAGITPDPRGLSAFWYSSGVKSPYAGAGEGAPQMMMAALGLRNIFEAVPGGWASLSWEAVIAANPDILILVDSSWNSAAQKRHFLESNPLTAQLPAVQNQRYLILPFPASEAGVRSIPALVDLSRALAGLEVAK